jgi:N-acylneuraminate cytidylyltransferase
MKVITVIPARGGSKGIPKKNIYPLNRKPLLTHTIEHALNAQRVDEVIISTDDGEIAAIANKAGADVVMRPDEISGDYSQSEEAIKHVLSTLPYKPEVVVMLQCTSPLRTSEQIDNAVCMVTLEGYDSVLSAVPLHQFVWRGNENSVYPINYNPIGLRPMRQAVKEWVENGSIYVFRTEILERYGTRLGGRIGILEMPYWSRFEIDTVEDLKLIEWIKKNEFETVRTN